MSLSHCMIALKPVVHLQRVNGSFVKWTWVFRTLGVLWLDIGRMPEPLHSCLSERVYTSGWHKHNSTAVQCIQAQEIGWFITNEYFPSLGCHCPLLQEPLNQFWFAPYEICTLFVDNFFTDCKENKQNGFKYCKLC